MSHAREIAEERLAKGEIDAEEYDRLIAKLPSQAVSPEKNQANQNSFSEIFGKFFGGSVVVCIAGIFIIGAIREDVAGGLEMGQLEIKGSNFSMSVANNSEKSGDVVLKVSAGEIEGCEHVFEMRPGRIDNLQFYCDMHSNNGRYSVNISWADWNSGDASVAKRIAVNW